MQFMLTVSFGYEQREWTSQQKWNGIVRLKDYEQTLLRIIHLENKWTASRERISNGSPNHRTKGNLLETNLTVHNSHTQAVRSQRIGHDSVRFDSPICDRGPSARGSSPSPCRSVPGAAWSALRDARPRHADGSWCLRFAAQIGKNQKEGMIEQNFVHFSGFFWNSIGRLLTSFCFLLKYSCLGEENRKR